MCEQHELLDYFVLYICPSTDTRLRLHIHTGVAKHRPHNHRFSFCTKLLYGSYEHYWHHARKPIDTTLTLDDLETVYISTEQAGSSYALSANAIHTTYVTTDTVSLFVRGPAETKESVILDRATQTTTWRISRNRESKKRRAKVSMSSQAFDVLCDKLTQLRII
jgi:hypothetical protein